MYGSALLKDLNMLKPSFRNFMFAEYLSTRAQVQEKRKIKSLDEMPGPKPLPIIGNLMNIKNFGGEFDIIAYDKFVEDLNKKYGDIVKWSLFNHKEVFTYNPEHFKIVFGNEGITPNRPSLDPWILYARQKKYPLTLVNSQKEEWKAQRTASNPIVARPSSVLNYFVTHNEIADEFINIINKKIHSNGSESIIFDKFQAELKFVILEMMSIVAFDKRLYCINEEKRSPIYTQLFDALGDYAELTSKLFFGLPLWKYYPTETWNEFVKVSDFIYDFARKYVEESRDLLLKNGEPHEQKEKTMLQQFLIRHKNSNLSFETIVSLMSEFLLASFDTTSTTLHYLFYEIAHHPEIQDELFLEVSKTSENLTEDDLSKIPLVKASLKESQRLHSIAPFSTRILSQDIVLDDFLIPKGTPINFGLKVTSYSEKYFKSPLVFNPKRWTKENKDQENINPFSSLPFGFGARQCIGRRLAEQKMYLILIKVLKNYKLEYVGEKLNKKFKLILQPDHDLKLKLIKRQ